MKKVLLIIGLSLALVIAVIAVLGWNSYKKYSAVKAIAFDSNLLILQGGGGNSIILTSDDETQALIVDTKIGGRASAMLASKVKAPNITVVNTHLHRDHTAGNDRFPNATIIAGAYTHDQWKALAGSSRYPDSVILPGEEIVLSVGGEKAHVRNMGAAHTWDDVVVFLENRKFLVTGDIVFHHRHPAMFVQGGTNAALWVRAIDSLLVLYDPKTVLPGHGDLSDKSALADQKEYFVTIDSALGNPEKMDAAREKYKSYPSMPVLATFDKTVAFLENEKKTAKQKR